MGIMTIGEAERRMQKAKYRGGSGSRLHRIRGLTEAEAARWIVHDRRGRSWARERGEPLDQLVDHLVLASQRAADQANKRANNKEPIMEDKTITILKNARALGEHGVTKLITDYAKKLYPAMTREAAFVKVFTADDATGLALRTIHAVSKGQVTDADAPEREYGIRRSRGIESAALDDDEVGDAADDIEGDALSELEALAEKERKRSGTSKAVAFSKVYCDPANAHLAARERRQNRPRA